MFSCSKSPSTAHHMIDHQHHNRSNHGNHHAAGIKTGDPGRAQGAEDNTTHDCPDNAEDEVEKEALSGLIHDLTGNEPGRRRLEPERPQTMLVVRGPPPAARLKQQPSVLQPLPRLEFTVFYLS